MALPTIFPMIWCFFCSKGLFEERAASEAKDLGLLGVGFLLQRCFFKGKITLPPNFLGCKRGWPLQKETSENGFTTMPSQNTWWWDARHVSVFFVRQNLDNLIRRPTLISHIFLQMAFWVVATQIIFGMFIPIWNRFPIWRSYFSEGLVQPPTRLDEEKFWEGNKNDSHFCCFEPWFFKWATRKTFAWLVWVL